MIRKSWDFDALLLYCRSNVGPRGLSKLCVGQIHYAFPGAQLKEAEIQCTPGQCNDIKDYQYWQ
eukprot:5780298-Amphidinium_carterae.1